TTEFVQARGAARTQLRGMKRTLTLVTSAALAAATFPTSARSAPMSADTLEKNKQAVRTLYEVCINQDQPARLAEVVSPDYVGPQGERGPQGYAATVAALRQGFPDIHFTVHDLVAEGDRVVVRWTWEGTHSGTFRTWAPT